MKQNRNEILSYDKNAVHINYKIKQKETNVKKENTQNMPLNVIDLYSKIYNKQMDFRKQLHTHLSTVINEIIFLQKEWINISDWDSYNNMMHMNEWDKGLLERVQAAKHFINHLIKIELIDTDFMNQIIANVSNEKELKDILSYLAFCLHFGNKIRLNKGE